MKQFFTLALSLVLVTVKSFTWAWKLCSVSFFRVDMGHCVHVNATTYDVMHCIEDVFHTEDFIFVETTKNNLTIPFCHLKTLLEDHIGLHLYANYSRLESLYSSQQSNAKNKAYYSLLFFNKSLTVASHTHLQCLLPHVRDLHLSSVPSEVYPNLTRVFGCGPNNTCCSNIEELSIRKFDLRAADELLFQGLDSLKKLKVTGCLVHVLRVGHLNKLTILSVIDSDLKNLDLSWVPVSLESFNLRGNPLPTITDKQNRAPSFKLIYLNIEMTEIDPMHVIALFPSLKMFRSHLLTLNLHAFSRTPHMIYLSLSKRFLRRVERFSVSSFENRSSHIVISLESDNMYCHCDAKAVDWKCTSHGTIFDKIMMLSVESQPSSFCQYVAHCPGDDCESLVYHNNYEYKGKYKCESSSIQMTETVDCGGLQLRQLPSNIFSTRKTHFYLDGNNFTSVDLGQILIGSQIKVLFLNGSNIVWIKAQAQGPEGSECYSNEISELYLQKNNIIHIQPKQFYCLTKLQILNLDGNRLASISNNLFKRLKYLRKLYLQRNRLQYVESFTFANLKELEMVHMEENSLQDDSFGDTMDLSNQYRLRTLNLSTNKFRTFPRILLRSNNLDIPMKVTTCIDSVLLNNNEIQDLSASWTWLGVVIRELHLEANQIEVLTKQGLSNLTHVKRLFLKDNNIRWISKDSFKPMVHLEYLHLQRNPLVKPRVWEYGIVWNLTKLMLDNTSFVCDCEYVGELLLKRKAVVPILDVLSLNCITDITNEQYGIDEYLVNFCQFSNSSIIPLSTASTSLVAVSIPLGALLLTIILVPLFYKYRFEARVLLYSKFPNRLLKDPIVDENKRWDIFVAYSGADLDFVAQKLHPGLGRYRTCYHDRDFVVGAFVTDNINQSIRDSCCTLVVLSNAFLQSGWCQYEFKMAHMKAMQDKCRRLLAIVIEDLDTTNMDEEIAAYLRTKTYLRWDDRLFWSKLYFSLPTEQNRNQIEDTPVQELVSETRL